MQDLTPLLNDRSLLDVGRSWLTSSAPTTYTIPSTRYPGPRTPGLANKPDVGYLRIRTVFPSAVPFMHTRNVSVMIQQAPSSWLDRYIPCFLQLSGQEALVNAGKNQRTEPYLIFACWNCTSINNCRPRMRPDNKSNSPVDLRTVHYPIRLLGHEL
jgi:hypothetical protein